MPPPIDVLFISRYDLSNLGFRYAAALREIGVNARAVKEFSSGFYRQAQCKVVKQQQALTDLVARSRCLVFMHSVLHSKARNTRHMWSDKFVSVFHGGRAYRRNREKINAFFNPQVQATLIQTRDLWGPGLTNPHWMPPVVNVDRIVPLYCDKKERYKIGHFPREEIIKRTHDIRWVMRMLAQQFQARTKRAPFWCAYSTKSLPWVDNIKRLTTCDIYLESLALADEKGFPIGEWGCTTAEAAAGGAVVLSIFRNREAFVREFGPCPMPRIAHADDMLKHLRDAVLLNKDDMSEKQHAYRAWAERTFSYKVIGERLKGIMKAGLP